MKTLKRSSLLKLSLAVSVALILSQFSSAHAMESIEVTGQYSNAVGSQGQNFKPSLGFNASLYVDRLIDPAIANFVSVGFNSFTLKTDDTTKFRVFPILAGLEFQGKVFSDLTSTFAVAIGGAAAYITATGAGANMNVTGYFAAQIKAGLQLMVSDGFSIVGRAPINFLVGKSSLTYLSYELGVQFKL
jgi:hypothetical protein